jgi:predicted nuclease of predicted toxin-antitoxin system
VSRFLADENVPRRALAALRTAGHDVLAIAETAPGTPDAQVLARARAEGRILLTFDRDMGELIYVQKVPVPAGVILLRPAPLRPDEAVERVVGLLRRAEKDLSLDGQFTVVTPERIRQRPLPAS